MTYAGSVSKIALPFPGALTNLKRRHWYTTQVVVVAAIISTGTYTRRIMTCETGTEKDIKRGREREEREGENVCEREKGQTYRERERERGREKQALENSRYLHTQYRVSIK